ncbi:hypothetical protein BDZ89DRAFT_1061415 [Hymenopellis radicata]|nr:hypothetical protein BDZ89DRAFT_1061415 [Hymenopellis radicata]
MNDWATTDEERAKGCAAQGTTEPRCTRNKEPLSCDEQGATKGPRPPRDQHYKMMETKAQLTSDEPHEMHLHHLQGAATGG